MHHTQPHFPFTAICAQDTFKLALTLCMIEPGLGGVLATGDKGTGKSTTVRALSQLMRRIRPDYPFVNLPVGATEERVLGTADLEILIQEKRLALKAGLLAQAHGGILYIDEVNLLSDFLTDSMLDAAAAGGYHLERDHLSVWQPSRFCLVGTMNPEEGELRPQLRDRFGLSVHIQTPQEASLRRSITDRRVAFDDQPALFCQEYDAAETELAQCISHAQEKLHTIQVPEHIREKIASICIQSGAEGLRADILLTKASRAHAAYRNVAQVDTYDLEVVLPLVLAHRSREMPRSSNPQSGKEPDGIGSDAEGYTKTPAQQTDHFLQEIPKRRMTV